MKGFTVIASFCNLFNSQNFSFQLKTTPLKLPNLSLFHENKTREKPIDFWEWHKFFTGGDIFLSQSTGIKSVLMPYLTNNVKSLIS